MNALFFILFTLFIIVFQTVVLPLFSFFINCFDLMIINVLFLSLISRDHFTVFSIIVIGWAMDSIAGVPFTYHMFSYLWIYIIVKVFRRFFFQRSVVFIVIMSLVSVLIQHVLLLLSIFVKSSDAPVIAVDVGILIQQAFWGVVIIPPAIWIVEQFWKQWIIISRYIQDQWYKAREETID